MPSLRVAVPADASALTLPVRTRAAGRSRMLRGSSWITAAVLIVVAGTLAFGGVYPWAYYPLLGLVGAFAVVALARARPARHTHQTIRRLGIASACVLAAIVIQLVPLPATWIARVSPATHAFLEQFDLSYAPGPATGGAATTATRHPLSIHPERSRLAALFWVALSLYVLGLTALLSETGSVPIARRLVLAGVVVAFIGIIQKAWSPARVYGFWTPFGPGDIFGPFVNKNHFAGWMAMALGVAVGDFRGRCSEARGPSRIRWWSSREASELVLTGGAMLVMAAALVLSMSRSGLTSAAAALCLSGALAGGSRGDARRRWSIAAVCLLACAAVSWIGFDRVAMRFAAASWHNLGGRLGAWRDAMDVVASFPLVGIGLNTYGDAMLVYQLHDTTLHATAAHNDYLQLAAEGGILLGLPVLGAAVVVIREISRRFKAGGDDARAYWIRVGAATGLIAIALQSVVDFSLQIPATALLCATLIALALHRNDAHRGSHAPARRCRINADAAGIGDKM